MSACLANYKIVITNPDKKQTVVSLMASQRLNLVKGALVTVVDAATNKPARDVVAKRAGNKLLIEINKGELSAEILDFYQSTARFEQDVQISTQALKGLGAEGVASADCAVPNTQTAEQVPSSFMGKVSTFGAFLPIALGAGVAYNISQQDKIKGPATPSSAPSGYKDDVGSVTSNSSTASSTDDTRPGILVGTGLTTTPKLYVNGTLVAATYDSAAGTLTPDVALTQGSYTFTYSLTDAAGNESGQSPSLSVSLSTTPQAGDAVISLGSGNGQLIAPIQADGKWYYFWDRNSSGTVGGLDDVNHNTLEAIFKYDSSMTTIGETSGTYRYAIMNDIKVALPTLGTALTPK